MKKEIINYYSFEHRQCRIQKQYAEKKRRRQKMVFVLRKINESDRPIDEVNGQIAQVDRPMDEVDHQIGESDGQTVVNFPRSKSMGAFDQLVGVKRPSRLPIPRSATNSSLATTFKSSAHNLAATANRPTRPKFMVPYVIRYDDKHLFTNVILKII